MAIGLLGSATADNAAATVYTVPAGISHAVVHITLTPGVYISGPQTIWSGTVSVAGVSVIRIYNVISSSTTPPGTIQSQSVSMMLSPGNSVTVASDYSTGFASCTVSGYTVA
jgi:hypothetical protein